MATLLGGVAATAVVLAVVGAASAQTRPEPATALDWRHVGNSAIDLGLAAVATGPVTRVWYSPDGIQVFAATGSGRVFSTSDLDGWTASQDLVPASAASVPALSMPEPHATVRDAGQGRLYAFGQQAWRSDDGGLEWTNLTGWNGESLMRSPISDLAVSPADNDQLVIATSTGVWRSADGGLSWSGLNDSLPGFAGRRFGTVPSGVHGFSVAVAGLATDVEWAPGERVAWRPVSSSLLAKHEQRNQRYSAMVHATVTAVGEAGDFVYAGSADGRLFASNDRGQTWRSYGGAEDSGPVEAIHADARDPQLAVAVSGARAASLAGTRAAHVRRTINGGEFWDDVTANLPDAAVHGVAVDRNSGAVYVASDAGVYFAMQDLNAAAPAASWTAIGQRLPAAPARDVRLDANGNQLFVLLDNYGVYTTIAPHRFRFAQVVSAADYDVHPAAPGAVLTVLGAQIGTASAGEAPMPVLAASGTESQIQVPFDVQGSTLALSFDGPARRLTQTMPLQAAAPAIFTDRDGAPMAIDAGSGLLLDASRPARPNMRVQILATGLGRVSPDWPTGVPAPLSNPPRVNATVHAWLDREPVEVSQATLASGYTGMYVIEVRVPSIVNAGPAELYVDADGHESNRVRIWVQP
jgi:uncharacterized protein (TIGR03437 family)